MIPTEPNRPRGAAEAWSGLLDKARLAAAEIDEIAREVGRIEDVMPQSELGRSAALLEELSPRAVRRRRDSERSSRADRIPGLRLVKRLRDEVLAIADFCDQAAVAFADLARKLEEVERRIESLESR